MTVSDATAADKNQTGKRSSAAFEICLAVVLSIGGIAACLKSVRFKDYYFTSDTLYTFAFFQSVKDGTLSSFQFSHLPNLFPEAAIIFPLLAAGLPLQPAYAIYSALIFLLLTLSVREIFRTLAPDAANRVFFIFVIAALAIFAFHPGRFLHVILAGIHGASFAMSVLGAHLAWRLLSGRSKRRTCELIGLCAITTATTFSDVLFVFEFAIPLIPASAVLVVFRGLPVAWAAIVNTAMIGASAVGWALLQFLPFSPFPPSSPADLIENAHRFVSSMQISILLGSVLPFIVICAVFAALLFHRAAWAQPLILRLGSPMRDASKADAWLFYWAFGMTASLAGMTLAAVAYQNFGAYRYAIAFFWWPLILGLTVLEKPSLTFSKILPRLAAVGVGCLVIAAVALPSAKFWAVDLDRCLADQSKRIPLNDGLAGYWIARPLTLLSDQARVVSQVIETGDPYLWINNRHDYFANREDTDLRAYNFVILNNLDRPQIAAKFGEPSNVLRCGDYEIAQYDNAAAIRKSLSGWFAQHP